MNEANWGRQYLAVLGCLVLSFSGCNKPAEPDSTPPDHIIKLMKSQGKYRFGITDTIAIDFSEKIDTAALALEFTPPGGIDHQLVDGNRLLIFGKNRTYEGTNFNINAGPFTVALTGLRDLQGNGQPRIEETFTPFPWVDQDFVDSNFNGQYDSLYATDSTWIDGSPISDSLISEGSLDFRQPPGKLDYQDIRVVKLTGGDTLYASLTTRKDLDLSLYIAGPFSPQEFDSTLAKFDYGTVLDSAQTLATGSAMRKIPADLATFHRKFGKFDATALYALIISVPRFKEGFYRVGVQIHKFK